MNQPPLSLLFVVAVAVTAACREEKTKKPEQSDVEAAAEAAHLSLVSLGCFRCAAVVVLSCFVLF